MVLETERLYLRNWTEEDAEALFYTYFSPISDFLVLKNNILFYRIKL